MNSKTKVLSIIGTRPEAIKMAPVVSALNSSDTIESTTCLSGQHPEMARDALRLFNLEANIALPAVESGGDLTVGMSKLLLNLREAIEIAKPEWVLVHGDTMTTAAGALVAFQNQIKIAHVEAGLRTGNLQSPWPEEGYRRIVAPLADMHFAPTESACCNLLNEGIARQKIIVTGNTVVDALLQTSRNLRADSKVYMEFRNWFAKLIQSRRPVLVTAHRRENHDGGIAQIAEAVRTLAGRFPCHCFILPVHPNPVVSAEIRDRLAGIDNVQLTDPLDYQRFVFAMERSELILTDSGGIQEEAPSFNTPVLVMRDHTERFEAIEAGAAQLVGSQTQAIVDNASRIIREKKGRATPLQIKNPFGDGTAALRILKALQNTSAPIEHELNFASLA